MPRQTIHTTTPVFSSDSLFLGTAPATSSDKKRALTVVILLIVAFGFTAPYAATHLRIVPAFVPVYNAAVCVLDLTTALLLFAQYRQIQERSLLVLTCAYVFTPLLVIAHGLSFPDAFIKGSLIGGSQTTSWLWMGWHALFPIFIATYSVIRYKEVSGQFKKDLNSARNAAKALWGTVLLSIGVILLCTVGEKVLPPLMIGDQYRSVITHWVLFTGWFIHLLALVLLVTSTRLRRLIEVWLAVILVALLIDLALSALLVNGRYQLGFYLGRVYGLLSACFLLFILLRESMALYRNQVIGAAMLSEREQQLEILNRTLEKKVEERTYELEENRQLFRATIDSSMDMIQVFKAVRDEHGEIIDFIWLLNNHTSEQVYGDVVGKSLSTLNPGVKNEGIFDTFKQVVETGIPDQSERYYVHEQFNGWFYQSTVKLGDGVTTTTSNITERKRAEQELLRLKDELTQKATDKYYSIFNSIAEGLCIFELLYDHQGNAFDWRFIEVNPAFEKQTGMNDVIGKTGKELTSDNTEPYWIELYDKVLSTGEAIEFENYHAATERWYHVYASRIGDGHSCLIATVFDDITKHKQQEQQREYLFKLNELLRPVADPIAIQQLVADTTIDYLGADRCYYAVIEGGNAIINRDAFKGDLPSVAGVYPLSSFDIFRKVVEGGIPVVVFDANTTNVLDESLRIMCLQLQIISFIDVPVIKDGKPVGILSLVQSKPRKWTDLEIQMAIETAERTWAAVERARAEAELKQSEERLKKAISIETIGVLFFRLDGGINDCNKAFERMVGYTYEELRTTIDWDMMTPTEFMEVTNRAAAELAMKGETAPYEKELIRKDGSRFWALCAPRRLSGEGESSECVEFVLDINEAKLAQVLISEDLRDMSILHELSNRLISEDTIQLLYDAVLDAAIQLTEADAGTVQIYDQETRELVLLANKGFDSNMIAHFSSVNAMSNTACGKALLLNRRTFMDYNLPDEKDPDGSLRMHVQAGYFSAQSTPLVSRTRKPIGMISTHWREPYYRPSERELRFLDLLARQAADLIEYRQSENALRKSEAQFRIFVNASSDIVYKMSADWSLMYFLKGKEFLKDAEESSTWMDQYILKEDQQMVQNAFHEAIATKSIFELEHRVLRADGTIGWTYSKAIPVLNHQGEILEWFGAASDITLRKQAEQQLKEFSAILEQEVKERTRELKESIDRFEAAIDVSPNVLCILKAIKDNHDNVVDFYFEWVSKSGEKLVGKDVTGEALLHAFPYVQEIGLFSRFVNTVETGAVTDFEHYYDAEGFSLWIRWKAVKLEDGLFVSVEDITERKKAEEDFKQEHYFLEQVTDKTPHLIYVFDLDEQKFNYINSRALQLIGRDQEYVYAMGPYLFQAILHPDDLSMRVNYMSGLYSLKEGEIRDNDFRIWTGSAFRWFRSKDSIFKKEGGKVKQVIGIAEDVTFEKQLQNKIQREEGGNMSLN